MTSPPPSPATRLAQAAVVALRRGDRGDARRSLDDLYALGKNSAAPWLIVGQVEQALGDEAAAATALTRHLDQAPRELLALLLLGAIKGRMGDERAAWVFYNIAMSVVRAPNARVPSAYVPLIDEAERFLAAAGQRFAAHLEQAVRYASLDRGHEGTRVRSAIDLLLGRTEVYSQQPSMFYLPGLAQRPFFERDEFAWLAGIEAAVPDMRRELMQLLAMNEGFAPYIQRAPNVPPPDHPLLDDGGWAAQYLWRDGMPTEPAATRCPATMAALTMAPIPVIQARSPMALFSRLTPGTHIRPHHGLLNTRLICHVPLIAPSGCGLRVGAETRHWREGEALIFDDSIEHEAWNRGDSVRVVLLFEVWRPDVTPAERLALTGIFEAIDDYRGVAVDAG